MLNNTIQRAWLNLVSFCNNDCIWCYANSTKKEKVQLTKENYLTIIEFLVKIDCKNVVLVGGEPTLYNDLFDILEQLSKNGFSINLVTNGRKYAENDFIQKIKFYRNKLSTIFSVEGTSYIHNHIAQRDCFDLVIKGIDNCIENGMSIGINTTLCSYNIDNLSSMYELFLEKNISNYSLNIAIPPFNSIFHQSDYIQLKQINRVLKNISKVITNESINFTITTPLPLCCFDDDILDYILNNKIKLNNMCHICSGAGITFTIDGGITPCTHFMEIETWSINLKGNIDEFWKFWKIEYEDKIRNKLNKFPSLKCTSCQFNNKCIGGCPILWSHKDFYEEVFN